MVAVSSIALIDKLMAKGTEPVVAETLFGKIRGIGEPHGIKIFKGIPMVQIPAAETGLCPCKTRINGQAYAML